MKAFTIRSSDLLKMDAWSVEAIVREVYDLVDGIYRLKEQFAYTGLPATVGADVTITRKHGAEIISLHEICALLVKKKITRSKFTQIINDNFRVIYKGPKL